MTEYQKQLRRQKFWYIFHKIFPRKKYYFVATIREEKRVSKDCREYMDQVSRPWGFYKSKRKAIKAVRENWTDMNENGYYHWAIIEPYNEGLVAQDFSEEAMWFEEDYVQLSIEDMKKIEAECPEDLKDKCRIYPDGYVMWFNKDRQICTSFNGYKPCSVPEWADHVCGWAL